MAERHKCSACYKQYKIKEHLVAHMKVSYHSVHQPKCGVCQKHCKSLESLREHIIGPWAKSNCARIFSSHGCDLCLEVFDSPSALNEHREGCRLPPPVPLGPAAMTIESSLFENDLKNGSISAIAMDCEMVGGGKTDICARVCLVDEDENIIFHTYVQPETPVTDYRNEVTGVTEGHLSDAMPLKAVREKIMEILYNGESMSKAARDGGKARLLVGHSLEYDLDSLGMKYPNRLLRDTARYPLLMKTNLVSHSLKYLTKKYLEYDIQTGLHDPVEDSVSAMRLYKRMRAQEHIKLAQHEGNLATNGVVGLDLASEEELEKMSPDELNAASQPNYRCWCLDLTHNRDRSVA